MYDLSYFNLGFRSDSVSNVLIEIKNSRLENSSLLKDAVSIIKDCLIIQEDTMIVSKLAPGKGYEVKTIVPILQELFYGENTTVMIRNLKKIKGTIDKVEKRGRVSDNDFDYAIDFFSQIADLCLSNSVQQSLPDNFSQL